MFYFHKYIYNFRINIDMRIYEFTDSTIQEGPEDPHIFKAVFMAGAPGAGKSTVGNALFSSTGLRQLNVDKFWKLYNTKGADGDYDLYWKKYQKQEKVFLSGRLGLLIDGTAKNPLRMKSVKEALEDIGYETAMVAVNVSLETSIRRAEQRANDPDSSDYGRHIDEEFIKETWTKVQQGMGALQRIFGQKFYIVDNNVDGKPANISFVAKEMRRWLSTPARSPIAKKWIEDAKKAKQNKGLED
jgi:predicted kinase